MEHAEETIQIQCPEIFELHVKTQAILEKLKLNLKEDSKSRLKDEQQIMKLELKVKSDLVLKKLKEQQQNNRVKGY